MSQASEKEHSTEGAGQFDLGSFFDIEPFWVIWQVGRSPRGDRRIRRISQNYGSEALANADADRYRKSGAVTWVEQARPLAPLQLPPAAIEALNGASTTVSGVSTITPAVA